MKHLDDEQIQAYVDGHLPAEEMRKVKTHLQECSFCRKEVQVYGQLFNILQQDIDFQLSANFARRTVSRIKKKSLGTVYNKLITVFFGLFGIILAVNISLYYVNFTSMINEFKQDTLSFDLQIFTSIFEQINIFISQNNIDVRIILFAGIILLLLAVIDRFVLQSRTRSV
ncbi:MAG: hypothetical protein GXO75_19350 [Calditrichaeota bacterium]|nr:hypothetical protein [Calditrichota bacterium]